MEYLKSNISYYTIPAAWVIAIAPHIYCMQTYDAAKKGSKYDNTAPRGMAAKIAEDKTLDAKVRDRLVRAEGAQQNGFENLGLFAAPVVAANVAAVAPQTLNLLSLGYLVNRIVYNFIYINNSDNNAAMLRTGWFFGGLGIIFSLFILAGNKAGVVLSV